MNKRLLLTALLLFTACEQKVDGSTQEPISENNLSLIQQDKINHPKNDILKQLGFDIHGEKVTIDINKTAQFVKKMEIEMHSRADEIEHKIEKADINFTKGLGIEVNGDRVAIDLNKTKDMLQQINILMKSILLDVNHTTH